MTDKFVRYHPLGPADSQDPALRCALSVRLITTHTHVKKQNYPLEKTPEDFSIPPKGWTKDDAPLLTLKPSKYIDGVAGQGRHKTRGKEPNEKKGWKKARARVFNCHSNVASAISWQSIKGSGVWSDDGRRRTDMNYSHCAADGILSRAKIKRDSTIYQFSLCVFLFSLFFPLLHFFLLIFILTYSRPMDPIRPGTGQTDYRSGDTRTRRMGEQAKAPRLLGHFLHFVVQQRHDVVVLLPRRQPPRSQGGFSYGKIEGVHLVIPL